MTKTEEFNKIMAQTNSKHSAKKQAKSEPVIPILAREGMNDLQVSLSKCTIQGNKVLLPEEFLANYKDVRAALHKAGGTYKRNSFEFNSDPMPFIERLMTGASVNIKKEFQFYETPDDIADWMAEQLFLGLPRPLSPNLKILEPEAGQGALIKAVYRVHPELIRVHACELMPENASILKSMPKVNLVGDDFLKLETEVKFDRIIANPPFAKNQDIDHIYKMWEVLAPGGTIVTCASKHWQLSKNKKETAFRTWIEDELEAGVYDLENGRFKSSGTMVGACIIEIDKPLKAN